MGPQGGQSVVRFQARSLTDGVTDPKERRRKALENMVLTRMSQNQEVRLIQNRLSLAIDLRQCRERPGTLMTDDRIESDTSPDPGDPNRTVGGSNRSDWGRLFDQGLFCI